MSRGRLIGALALALATAAFGWGLWTLHGVFAAERAAAMANVESRRRVLDRHAADALAERLARRLAAARPQIAAAMADPLAPIDGVFSRYEDRLRIPPPRRHARAARPGFEPVAIFETLRNPQNRHAADGPWGERLALRGALIDAVATGEPRGIEAAMRAFLAHRLRHVLAPEREVASTLAVLAWFVDAVAADPALLRAVLHDGVGRDPTREGVQRTLLRHRAAFTEADFRRLADETLRLSARGEVPREAFRAAIDPPPPPPIPADVPAPALVDDGRWYVEPHPAEPGRVDGVRLDPATEIAALEDEMRRGALLEPGESLLFDPRAPVPVAVSSPAWTEQPARARATWRLKVGLLWSCALLAGAVVALVLLDVRRRRRFVELKSDFIAAVSHELRTPLAAIRLMAETLERRLGDVPRARDYPARIVREVDGLGFLVENLLSFNRIDKGRWVARRRPVRLAEVVERIRQSTEAAFDRPITWRLSGLDVAVDADPALLELLVANLVRNAVQHSEGPVTLSIAAQAGPGAPVRLQVADDGPGVPLEARAHVFEAFWRGPARTSRGSGLGLALCRRIAALHGGAIRLVDQGGAGATFEVELPPAPESTEEAT